MPGIYNTILDTIGHTPVVRINKLAPPGVNLYVKAEAFNPMGSVKDRLALGIIQRAEQTGELKPGQTVIEATSGNTGIGLAMVCAVKGYPLVVTMAENFSIERRRMMRFLGAKVVLTPAALKGSGMLAKAAELAETHGWFLCRQFENEANADMHSRTTAPEILEAFEGQRLDYWVSGFGTGGTLKGVARVLRQQRPETRIIVCEPDNAPLLGSGVVQKRDSEGQPDGSHPSFRPHLMQGWTPDFIPKLTEDAVAAHLFDQILPIDGMEALRLSRELAQKEGIFTGISGGATFSGALQIAEQADMGANILCMLPDTGERYLSTPLFENIPTDMTDEEWDISCSTPCCRFDKPVGTPAEQVGTPAEPDSEQARRFVEQVINDSGQPVVLFALEWCEFCWSVRKFFERLGIAYRSIDLDSVEYQADNRGGKIRHALNTQTGFATIPQIFVGGEFVGGCSDLFDAYKEGRLQKLLDQHRVSFDSELQFDPYSLLPGWLQPR
ncbi:cysteine synthase A [Marinobacterium arenosum]|uniref:cysteine synthase A n=1 Tax=Marinobacterium arenosum TaxID=2862496 RepID=UPI001C9460F9|nr:cysteine synthase A [Marinobacterium arenosum]MBY4676254.1 cysteine synthase A [Marinobacterium arenosum]